MTTTGPATWAKMVVSAFKAVFARRCTALLLSFFFLLHSPAHAERLDTELEKILGKPMAWGMVETSGADIDPLLLRWVQRIGAAVSAAAPRQDIRYTFGILGTDTANAYALPGGYIFVTRGLLDTVESDDELASILAHETGHVSKRHATQLIGGNLLFYAALNSIRGRRYEDVKTALQVMNLFRTLQKSREMEAQADAEGIAYAFRSGYDPEGLTRFFERLVANRGASGRLAQYFATHPSPRKRLERARSDPRVRRRDAPTREAVAVGYAARGLVGAAAAARRGDGPLLLPPPAVVLSPARAEERRRLATQVAAVGRALGTPYRIQQVGERLRQVLLINNQIDNLGWTYLALRAYAIQTDAENIYERTVRAMRTALPTYDGLTAFAGNEEREAAQGQAEVGRAVEKLQGAPAPLARASRAALGVLADLNNPLYHPKGAAAWARYAALEGLLRYAESELARAGKASGQAWRLLALARVRRYTLELSGLVPETDPARRALWADLARRRLGGILTPEGSTGAATVRAALAIQLGRPAAVIEAGRGETSWADWILEKRGIPENIATVMRLLTLDLEREMAARDRYGTADD